MAGSGRGKDPLRAPRRPSRGKSGGSSGRPGDGSRHRAERSGSRRERRRGPVDLLAGLVRWAMSLGFKLIFRAALVAVALVGVMVAYTYTTLPPAGETLDGRSRGSVTLMDRYGDVFAWRGEQFGGQIEAETVSPHLHNAIVATEDRRFYMHPGVDPLGIAGAIRINLREGRGPLTGHGGSTITQQTAKLLCYGTPYDPDEWESEAAYEADCRETSLVRKAQEAIYAMAMEAKYTKEEVLTIYLNRAYLGAGTRGFEAAAQRYFGKSANAVDPAEAAMLAGLLVAPTRYAPTNDLSRSQNRAEEIIGLMRRQDYLTDAQADEAIANPAVLSAAAEARAGGYFADWVMSSGPDFLTTKTTEDVILRTTFDQRIQNAAEGALEHVFDTQVREGSEAQSAIVVMSADGAVRAMVGGRKFRGVAGQFNRAVMAKRQTGSAFKPFIYATALELGYSPNDTVVDEPITLSIPGSGTWSPDNYTNDFAGPMSLTEALKDSRNIPAVKVSEGVDRDNVRHVASDFGIASEMADGPSIALGASESTLLEMSGAYAGILNGGSSVEPYGILDLRLQGSDEVLLGQEGGIGERVISREAAEQLTYMMSRVIEDGTGSRARLEDREAAGKTGTTQGARDAWFVGFTADYVVGVWMGYDDNTPLTGVTGGGLPAEIWRETMVRVSEGTPPRPLPMRRPDIPTQQVPQYEGDVASAQSGSEPLPSRQQANPDDRMVGPADIRSVPAAAGEMINDVLGSIFGR